MSAIKAERLRFHHVGIACKDVASQVPCYEALGFTRETEMFTEQSQRIRGVFMTRGSFRVELLEPAGKDSPLLGYISRGIQMYHQAYEAPDFDGTIERLVAAGHKLVVPPLYGTVLKRRIAFVMLTNLTLIELLG